jgi:hypothetical protein
MHKHKLKPNQYHYCPTIDTALTLSKAVNGDINAQFDASLLLETGHRITHNPSVISRA